MFLKFLNSYVERQSINYSEIQDILALDLYLKVAWNEIVLILCGSQVYLLKIEVTFALSILSFLYFKYYYEKNILEISLNPL